MARREVADGGLIHLHAAIAEHSLPDVLVDGLQPFRGQPDPFGHRLPRQPDLMPRPVDGFLPVEGKVVAILAHDDLRQESRGHEAAFQE